MLLKLVKKEPKPELEKKAWLWEGTLEIPRLSASTEVDPVTKRPMLTWTVLYKEIHDVRLVM